MRAEDARGTEDASHSQQGHHHHEHGGHSHAEPMSQEEAVRSLLVLGQVALDASDYESAHEAYASALKLAPDETASYNLGSLYARGLGVRRDYAEAARLFHQAELLGNEKAAKLCAKCMYDFVCEGLDGRSAADAYAAMAVFASRVYPESLKQAQEVENGLLAIGATLLAQGERAGAATVFRAAADYCGSASAERYLDELEG